MPQRGDRDQRTDILKGFIVNQVGQTFSTETINRGVMDAFDELGVNYSVDYKNDKITIEKNRKEKPTK